MTELTIEETKEEMKESNKDFEEEIHTLEQEIYDQTTHKEYLIKLNSQLKKELTSLEWFFKVIIMIIL